MIQVLNKVISCINIIRQVMSPQLDISFGNNEQLSRKIHS